MTLSELVDETNDEQSVASYVQDLRKALRTNFYRQYPSSDRSFDFRAIEGRKFIKLVQTEEGRDSSVHAFIDKKTGEVYKPASWKSPAKHVRYNLLDERSRVDCLHSADWAGGYLYMYPHG
jgi:hypothetical protein